MTPGNRSPRVHLRAKTGPEIGLSAGGANTHAITIATRPPPRMQGWGAGTQDGPPSPKKPNGYATPPPAAGVRNTRAPSRGPHPGRRVGRRRVGVIELALLPCQNLLEDWGFGVSGSDETRRGAEFWRVDSVNVTRSEGGFGESEDAPRYCAVRFLNKSCSGRATRCGHRDPCLINKGRSAVHSC